METLVVVGTGHAANALVAGLSKHRYQGRVVLVGDEKHPPYNRPPLSKKFLSEDVQPSELYFRGEDQLAKNGVEVRLGVAAIELNPLARTLKLGSGDVLSYDKLVLSTGAAPRGLASCVDETGGNLNVLRNIADAVRLKADLGRAQSIAIIGAGYVGLEVAASSALLGKRVTVIEAAPRVLARVAGPELAGIVQAAHEAHGVSFRIQSTVKRVAQGASGFDVFLADGERVNAEIVLCAIGAAPNAALAEEAGLAVNRGIVTDTRCATSDDRIFAIGDCATFPRDGDLVQLESVQNASDQADVVARRLCGLEAEYAPLPWFWSDQYDLRLQSVGFPKGSDGSFLRSNESSHTIWHHRDGRIIALDTINASRDHMLTRKLMARGELHLNSVQEAEFDLARLWTQSGQPLDRGV
ncbi:NAD(P)/FAD-dependent oxidoreductase [Mesorhizobium escarrei]|uniref:Pyridine nucleotide-disulfide oxidoreductase n=1 Tax=Mesorhizobium escarrei TaxID=666018 RepID=A0ABN8KDR5_9HYPH|nr:FAD-dependent oxidoreductase [Mesorhizobium escarrei]CAH2408368.1 Pyridine nucleotide-disulfide oxidoreductase [Mesorhizobium escarrei]